LKKKRAEGGGPGPSESRGGNKSTRASDQTRGRGQRLGPERMVSRARKSRKKGVAQKRKSQKRPRAKNRTAFGFEKGKGGTLNKKKKAPGSHREEKGNMQGGKEKGS